jgi:hypothetical protein
MNLLTFKDFLSIVAEDAQQDIAKLMSDISMIDTQINQRTTPLLARKNALQKMLALKQRHAQAEAKQAGANGTSPMQAGQTGQPPAGQTTTPGGTGSATPGGAPSMNG